MRPGPGIGAVLSAAMIRSRGRGRTERVIGVLAITAATAVMVSCGSADSTAPIVTTSTTTPVELRVGAFADPAAPVTVGLGRRFAILLPAEPNDGSYWVLESFDPDVLVPLGSVFSEEPALLAVMPTPTTDPTDPTTVAEPTATVQVVSFAGRIPATTRVVFRAERLGPEGPVTGERVVFEVTVVPLENLLPPPAS